MVERQQSGENIFSQYYHRITAISTRAGGPHVSCRAGAGRAKTGLLQLWVRRGSPEPWFSPDSAVCARCVSWIRSQRPAAHGICEAREPGFIAHAYLVTTATFFQTTRMRLGSKLPRRLGCRAQAETCYGMDAWTVDESGSFNLVGCISA